MLRLPISTRGFFWRVAQEFAKCTSPVSTPIHQGVRALSSAVNGNLIEIRHGSGAALQVHPWWLRDHCRCDHCYNHATFQRKLMFHDIDPNIKPVKLEDQEGKLSVHWPDGHESLYEIDWLMKNVFPSAKSGESERFLWDAASIGKCKLPEVSYRSFMDTDEQLSTLLKFLLRYGFGVVSGVPPTQDATQEVAERVSYIQETTFGKVWTFTADGARGDTAYTNIALGAHTDSTYYTCSSGIQVFHVLHHDGEGGETLLLDGFHAAEKLRRRAPHSFNLLAETPLRSEYRETTTNIHSLQPVICVNPVDGQLEQIRYNHYDRAPVSTVKQQDIPALYEALVELSKEVLDPRNEHWLKLRPGMVLFVDNWRVMHGRSSFSGNRRVCGCYLPRDEWLSKASVLQCM